MAGSSTKEKELQLKRVQELADDGNEPPARYIYQDATHERSIDVSPPLSSIPIIDLQGFFSSSKQQREEEQEKLRSILSSCGCFQVIDHGISSSFLDKVHEVTKHFFQLPMEEKWKYSNLVDGPEGYGNDEILSEKRILDWSDRVYLYVLPEDKRKLQFWPESPNGFREILHEYTMKMKNIAEILFKAMARSLNLEENCFLKHFGERAVLQARFNVYPPCSRPDLVLGVKSHTDDSGITILLQDKEVEGVQILKDDQWIRVPIKIMSNGMFKSLMHRVVTNPERKRIPVAMFYAPPPETEIGPADGLITEKSPRLFKNVKNYVATYLEYLQQGKIPIDAAKI